VKPNSTRERIFVLLILALCFAVRAGFASAFWDAGFVSKGTEVSWWSIADHVAHGDGYVYAQGVMPTARRGPVPILLFALLIQVFGEQAYPAPVLIVQWLADVGTCYVLYLIATEVFQSRRVARWAMLLFALYIPEMTWLKAGSEQIYTFLLACFTLYLVRSLVRPTSRNLLWAGAWLGLATLTRPTAQAFPVLIPALFLIVRGRDWRLAGRATLVILASFMALLAPWTVRNYLVFRTFIPTNTVSGYLLLRDSSAIAADDYWRIRGESEFKPVFDEILASRGLSRQDSSEVELDAAYRQEAVKRILQYPLRYLVLCLMRFLTLWFNVSPGNPASMLSLANMAGNVLLLLLALGAYAFYRGPWTRLSLASTALILYFTALHVAIVAEFRYIWPVLPYLMMLVAFTLAEGAPAVIARARSPAPVSGPSLAQ
jgi:hypothetical protein